MKQRKVLKNIKGITLIALVITIIVLLILAGVTIATLTGENGILTQAGNAKEKTTEAEAIERVKVEVAGSYGLDGTIDIPTLNDNLRKNISGLTYKGKSISEDIEGEGRNRIEELPATVRLNGYDIEINSNGEVEKDPGIAAKIIANPEAYYGKKVTNYKASESDTNTYRIFYVDEENYFGDGANTIYLKADYSGSVGCSTSYDANQTLIKKMNPLWGEKRGTSESSWNSNEKASAWLCDPSKWTAYCDSDKANYAIGGPSVEMYVKSYNQTHGDDALGCQYQTSNKPGYSYKVNGTIQNSEWYTDSDTLDCSMTYNSMYCGQNGTKTGYWWLASPSAVNSDYLCYVYGDNAKLSYQYYSSNIGVSPLVSLKSSFIPQVEE